MIRQAYRYYYYCDNPPEPLQGSPTHVEHAPFLIRYLSSSASESAHIAEELVVSFAAMDQADGMAFAIMNEDPRVSILDSGCSKHFQGNEDGLINVKYVSGEVRVANNQIMQSTAIGGKEVTARSTDGKRVGVLLKGVVVVPGIIGPLLPVKRIAATVAR